MRLLDRSRRVLPLWEDRGVIPSPEEFLSLLQGQEAHLYLLDECHVHYYPDRWEWHRYERFSEEPNCGNRCHLGTKPG